MADPNLAEPAVPQEVLRNLDLPQEFDGDRRPVGDPRGEARVAWLVPERETEALREGADVRLRKAGLDEGVPEPCLVHRPDPGADVPEVGDVDPVRDGREPLALRERQELVR